MRATVFSAEEVRDAIGMPEAIAAVRDAFIAQSRGEFEVPVRTALRDGQFLVMSAHHKPSATAMIKTLSLNFDRTPAIDGTVVRSDLGGVEQTIADAGAVTTLRTGAASGVATDLLAPKDATHCVVIGAGGQAADQARAVCAVRPIEALTFVSRTPERAEALAKAMADELPGVAVTAGRRIENAVAEADVICCATTATEPLFALDALPPTVHINAIGAFRPTMREVGDEILADASVYVDEIDAVLEESGEIIHALDSGAIARDDLVELGTALASDNASGGRTIFKSVGIAVQDWTIADLLTRCG